MHKRQADNYTLIYALDGSNTCHLSWVLVTPTVQILTINFRNSTWHGISNTTLLSTDAIQQRRQASSWVFGSRNHPCITLSTGSGRLDASWGLLCGSLCPIWTLTLSPARTVFHFCFLLSITFLSPISSLNIFSRFPEGSVTIFFCLSSAFNTLGSWISF